MCASARSDILYRRAEKFMDHAACSKNISNRILTHFPVELLQIDIIYSHIINFTCYTRFCFCLIFVVTSKIKLKTDCLRREVPLTFPDECTALGTAAPCVAFGRAVPCVQLKVQPHVSPRTTTLEP